MRLLEECPHRHPTDSSHAGTIAVCRFLQQFTGITDPSACAVALDVCRSCCTYPEPPPGRLNAVVASLIYERAGNRVGLAPAQADAIRAAAESALALDGHGLDDRVRIVQRGDLIRRDPRPACDVVICCADTSDQSLRAIRSV